GHGRPAHLRDRRHGDVLVVAVSRPPLGGRQRDGTAQLPPEGGPRGGALADQHGRVSCRRGVAGASSGWTFPTPSGGSSVCGPFGLVSVVVQAGFGFKRAKRSTGSDAPAVQAASRRFGPPRSVSGRPAAILPRWTEKRSEAI